MISNTYSPAETLANIDKYFSQLSSGVEIFSLLNSNRRFLNIFVDIASKVPQVLEEMGQNTDILASVVNKDFFHPFPMTNMSMHYVPQKLSNAVLESGLFKVKQQTINDPEKEIDADMIIDCRGRHNRDKDNYEPLINPLNSALLYRKEGRDPYLHYTRTVATPNGWTFVVPNSDSVSYGYLYNNTITSKEDATEDFLERFELPEIDGDLTFENYIAKNVCVGERTFLNGNRCGFLEPLEATATGFYQNVCQAIYCTTIGAIPRQGVNAYVERKCLD